MTSFSTVLVANRGEIALRVFRTARALGYGTVAVYSDADAASPHVAAADQAVRIGPGPSAESYLRIDAVIDAAHRTGADAIHPGYGFLAENAAFAEACLEAGIAWIGPPAEAIRAMGDKARAKAHMAEAGVPTVPGYGGAEQGDEALRREADALGYPLLVKAVSGGGGRGMRLVHTAGDLVDALAGARREAEGAFGDGTVMLEAFVRNARHIEIQVFADTHGHVIHLGERDCTTQRRRQKVIEEAPSPAVDAQLRARMGADAVQAAQAIGYVGAGTVEMILGDDGRYFFLEMNTRLQVEHPVTELVTGQDLVAWQLRIAAGEPLPLTQEQVAFDGHAIEARLYAEDPYGGFAPQSGRILWFRPDAVADWPGVRVDAGVEEGGIVSPFYDPMVAKVLAHGRTRAEASRTLARALEAVPLVGLQTNQRFLVDLLRHEAFLEASIHTGTLDDWLEADHPLLTAARPTAEAWAVAASVLAQGHQPGFRSAAPVEITLGVTWSDERRSLQLVQRDGGFAVAGEGVEEHVTVLDVGEGRIRYACGPVQRTAFGVVRSGTLYLDVGQGLMAFHEASAYPEVADLDDPRRVTSPVAGTLLRLEVAVGDRVDEGDTLAIVEAMKMETRLVASRGGAVAAIHAALGQQVEAEALVIEVEVDDNEAEERNG